MIVYSKFTFLPIIFNKFGNILLFSCKYKVNLLTGYMELNTLKQNYLLIAVLSFLFTIPASAQVPNIIYDTDFGPDIDDVAALAMLHTLADNGEANILAAMVSSSHYWSPGGIDAVNTYYGRPDIPIGGRHDSPRPGGHAYVKTHIPHT
jgi:hypothetical protein